LLNTWCCIATGPSLTRADVEYCIGRGWRLATVNCGYQIAPEAEILNAFDESFWKEHYHAVRKAMPHATLYTGNGWLKNRYKYLTPFTARMGTGWSNTPNMAYTNGLSGYQLLQIAGWQKPDRLIMLGYDMQHTGGRKHCHPDHKGKNCPSLAEQIPGFAMAHAAPFPIFNATRETALTCFERVALEDL
jgi:hypothetical protein